MTLRADGRVLHPATAHPAASRRLVRLVGACAGALATIGTATLVTWAFVADGGTTPGAIAPIGAACLGAAVTALVLRGAHRRRAAHRVAMASLLVSAAALAGSLYGVDSLHHLGRYAGVALVTAAALVVLDLAVLWTLPDYGLLRLARSTPGTRTLVRRVLPVVFTVPLATGWALLEGSRAGWYDASVGLALFAVGTTAFVGLVLWLSARAVGSFEEALLAAFMRAQDDRDDLAVTVSEREAALASTEATQRASLESLEQGVAVSDLSGAVLLLNRAGRRLLGYEADELGELFRTGRWETYREDGTVLPPDERPLGITMRTGDAVRGALVRWRARSGELRLLRVSTEPLHDDDGGLRGVVTAFADITDAREAELRLKASEARFAALVERSSDVICVVDEQTHLRYVSPAGERLFGALVTASGRPFHALLHPEDRGPVTAAFRDLLDDPGGNRTVSFRVLTAHGRWCPVEVVATNRLHDPAVQGVVANLRDVSERAEAEERLRHLAFHDLLTGLPNRSLLLQRLDDAVESAAQGWAKPALLFVDLDRFKAVNDTFGHASGDLLLQRVAERIATCIGSGDTLARIGGDEFVVLVDDASQLGDTTELAARIIRSVEEPVELPNGVATVSASIGIAVDFDHDAEALLRRADTALYRAKAAGGRTSTVAAGDDDHDLPDAPPRRRRLSVAS